MSKISKCMVTLLLALSGGLLNAADSFTAIAPGDRDNIHEVEWRCPGFSWQQVEGATYEVMVERIDPSTLKAVNGPARVFTFPEGANTWMPSGNDCFERGYSYQWQVTANDDSGWFVESEVMYFRVPEAPSGAEIGQAIEVLRAAGALDNLGQAMMQSSTLAGADTPEGSTPEYAIVGETSATVEGSAAVKGEVTAATGLTFGVAGFTASSGGAGVAGINTATSGQAAGVFARTSTPGGAAVDAEAEAETGTADGVVGTSSAPQGAGIRAVHRNGSGGADLILDGSRQTLTDTVLTESGIDRPSASAEVFAFENSGSGSMTLRVDGIDVVTNATDQDTLASLSCNEDEIAQFSGGNWNCAAAGGGGDITSVIAGAGLTGGADSGDATLEVNFAEVQARVAMACGQGEALNSIDQNGNPVCVPLIPSEGSWPVAFGSEPSIALLPNGNPVIAFRDGGKVNVVACNDPFCRGGDETSSPIADGEHAEIAIGDDGLPVIVFAEIQDVWVAHCNDIACSGGDETITELNLGAPAVFKEPKIAIGADGFPFITFADAGIWAVKCNDVACTGDDETINSQVLMNPAATAGDVGLAIGANGFPLIFFYRTDDDRILLIRCNDDACQGQNENERSIDSGFGIDALSGERLVTFTASDNPVMGNSGGDIYRCDTNDCASISLVPGDTLRDEVSGARGPDGHPAFVHTDGSALIYSRCPDAECTQSVRGLPLFTRGSSIGESSLTFGADGSPIISFKETAGVATIIRVYRCAQPNCL